MRRVRYSAAAPRYLALTVIALFFALGVRAAFFATASPAPAPLRAAAADAPSEDFALQFARAYLTYDAAHSGRRVRALAPYVGDQLARGAGFAAQHGFQWVLWEEIASDQPSLAGGRVITVAAAVSTQRLPLYLAVTVSHPAGQSLQLMGYPSLVGAPATAAEADLPAREAVRDGGVLTVVDRVLGNYLSGSVPNLKADLTPAAAVTLPTIALRLQSVDRVVWVGDADSGAVLATASALDAAGNTYTLTYELGIAYRERPYVDFIEVIPTAS